MSPRIPGRHDQPLEPLVMTEEDVVNFQIAIASGFGGQAQWRRDCGCEHAKREHQQGIGACLRRCGCRQFAPGQHQRLDLWLHPDAVNYLPAGVTVEAVGRRYNPDGQIQFRLVRDFDSAALHVVRSGVRKETDVFTSQPEEER